MGIFDEIRKRNKEASIKELGYDIQEAIELGFAFGIIKHAIPCDS